MFPPFAKCTASKGELIQKHDTTPYIYYVSSGVVKARYELQVDGKEKSLSRIYAGGDQVISTIFENMTEAGVEFTFTLQAIKDAEYYKASLADFFVSNLS